MPYTIWNMKHWAATNNIIVFNCKFFNAEKYKEKHSLTLFFQDSLSQHAIKTENSYFKSYSNTD